MSVWPVVIHTRTLPGIGSSPRQRLQDARQRRLLNIRPNENPIDIGKHDLNLATRSWTGIFLRLHRSDRYRQDRREVLRLGGLDATLPTLGEELVGVEVVPSSDLSDRSAIRQGLLDAPAFLVEGVQDRRLRPSAAPSPSMPSDICDSVRLYLKWKQSSRHSCAIYPSRALSAR
jgi:hypothetical protein